MEFGIFTHQIPIFFKTSLRVSHRMSIFALNQGLCHRIILTVFLTSVIAIIHRAIDVCLACFTGLFILYGTARVFSLYPIVGSFEISAIAGFVAQRPENDAGMIEATLHIALVTLHMCFPIVLTFGKCLFPITHSVGFDIGFGHYVNTILVAEVVPEIIVGIVAGAHGIQVELLHHLNILNHAFARNDVTTVRIHLVAVGSLEENGLAVDKYLTSFQLYLSEAHLYGNHFTAALQSGTQGIQVRRFRRPLMRILHIYQGSSATFGDSCSHLFSGSVQQFKTDIAATLHIKLYFQGTVLISSIQIGSDTDVLNALLVTGIQVAIAPYTAITEEVLVFQIRPVTPAEYLKGYQILLSRLQVGCQVEFSLQFAVLTITYVLAVYPQIHIGSHGTEMSNDVLTLPVGRYYNLTTVGTYIVILRWHLRWIVLELIAPGISGIHVDRVAETVQFPHTGNGHIAPSLVVEPHFPEIRGTGIGILHPEEFPDTVQSHVIGRMFFCSTSRSICRLIGKIVGVHRSTVHGIYFRVLPFSEGLCACGNGKSRKQSGNEMFLHGK